MARIHIEPVLRTKRLGRDSFLMTVKSSYVAKNAVPGQFVHIKCSETLKAYLRRPISICNVDITEGTFDLGIRIKGKGTEILSLLRPGEKVDFLGPLGRGFEVNPKAKKIAVVGGGIGVFPLLFLISKIKSCETKVFLGFKNKEHLIMYDEFSDVSDDLVIATEDGSFGVKGMVIRPFEEALKEVKFDQVYTCGPIPMMKAVNELCIKYGIPCQVSLEQRMGCGIGACLVCACKIKRRDSWDYVHVCKDGPVFNGKDVVW